MNAPVLTAAEIETEKQYRYNERLGILCQGAEPTWKHKADAEIEAEAWAVSYRKENGIPEPTRNTHQ